MRAKAAVAWIAALATLPGRGQGAELSGAAVTCGGLPPPSQYFDKSRKPLFVTGLHERCAQWEGTNACCTKDEVFAAVNGATENLQSLNLIDDGSGGETHCFYGFYGQECLAHLEWLACARNCDPLAPRNASDGDPVSDASVCYERFTARRGIDSVLYPSAGNACERAAEIQDLGSCAAVLVIGESELALAVGDGQAICRSFAARLVVAVLLQCAVALLAISSS